MFAPFSRKGFQERNKHLQPYLSVFGFTGSTGGGGGGTSFFLCLGTFGGFGASFTTRGGGNLTWSGAALGALAGGGGGGTRLVVSCATAWLLVKTRPDTQMIAQAKGRPSSVLNFALVANFALFNIMVMGLSLMMMLASDAFHT
jgi:hypothetical protein